MVVPRHTLKHWGAQDSGQPRKGSIGRGNFHSQGPMPTPKSIVLQARIPTRHARRFRQIVKREGLTVNAALYRHVLNVIKANTTQKSAKAVWGKIQPSLQVAARFMSKEAPSE